MAKKNRALLYGGLGVVVVVALVMTDSPPPTESDKIERPKRTTSGSKTASNQFTKEDETATFPELNESPRNAFKPLVARLEAGLSGGGLAPNEFPASYVGGETGWFYTGTVIVDDVPSALVENQVTGEGMYLKVGQRVKSAVIAQIAPTYIVVNGTMGQTMRLDLLRDIEPVDEFDGMRVEPVRPNVAGGLQGPIRPNGRENQGFLGIEEEQ